MPTEIKHFINGRLIAGKSGRTAPVFNPATGEETALRYRDDIPARCPHSRTTCTLTCKRHVGANPFYPALGGTH